MLDIGELNTLCSGYLGRTEQFLQWLLVWKDSNQ